MRQGGPETKGNANMLEILTYAIVIFAAIGAAIEAAHFLSEIIVTMIFG